MNPAPTELAARIRAGDPVVCVCLTQPAPAATTLALAAVGVGAVYVDLEHTALSLETAARVCVDALAAGLLPLVRVPTAEPATIGRALDGGALGVIVPHVESADAARDIVRAARLPPLGERRPYIASPALGYRRQPAEEAMATLEAGTVVVPMIESAAAVAIARDIGAVPGVDMLLVGAFDLANDLGCSEDASELREALRSVATACHETGTAFGVLGVRGPNLIADLVSDGLRFIGVGTEVGLLQQAAAAAVTAMRALPSRTERS